MITSGSPTEQFEICVSGAYFRGIWIPECGGHVTDRHTTCRMCNLEPLNEGWYSAYTVNIHMRSDCMTPCHITGRTNSLAFRSRVLYPEYNGGPPSNLFFFYVVHVAGVLINPPWDTFLASCGRRSPLRSVFTRGKVSVDVHRVVCQVAKAVLIFIAGTERGRGRRLSFRLETPVRGGGAFTPSWSGSGVVSFGYLVHG